MYEKLFKEGEDNGIEIIEIPLKGNLKGLYGDNVIAINSKITTNNEKTCILAEELGHHYTSCGDILDQSKVENKKQERRARAWAYDRMIGIIGLVNAYKHGCKNKYEVAEYLNVPEQFLIDAITYYNEKYGFYQIDNYIIRFEPLSVLEVWE